MRKTFIIDIDPRGECIWLMSCNHEMSKVSRSFKESRIFYELENARTQMVKEVQRVGRNLLEMWQRKFPWNSMGYHFIMGDDGYDCSVEITMDGKAVDCYVGSISRKTIE